MITFHDIFNLLPFVILAAAATLLLLTIGFLRHRLLTKALRGSALRPPGRVNPHMLSEVDKLFENFKIHFQIYIMAIVALVAAFLSIFLMLDEIPRQVTPLLVIDFYGLIFLGLILTAGLSVLLLSYGYLKIKNEPAEEYYALLLLAVLGGGIVVVSNHLVSFFLGLELINIALYGLIAYTRSNEKSLEAAFKYLILAAASDAFLLFGIALIYGETGSMQFSTMIATAQWTTMALAGMALIFVGIGFKLSLFPFQMWTPDVYEGAPAPITGFIATVSKAAVFAVLFRLLTSTETVADPRMVFLLSLMAIASMFFGNIAALFQTNVKRVLAYSSISHMGYVVIGLLAKESIAVTFYFIAYFAATLGAFGVITALSKSDRDADEISDYRGLAWRRPWLAAVFSIMLLSLAGIPVTAGFLAKFYLVTAGVGSSLWLLVTVLIINSVIGLFYYLRIMISMYSNDHGNESITSDSSLSTGIALAALMFLVISIGILPTPLLNILSLALTGR